MVTYDLKLEENADMNERKITIKKIMIKRKGDRCENGRKQKPYEDGKEDSKKAEEER